MSRENFIEGYLERMIEKDPEIKSHFNLSDETQRALLKDRLRTELGKSYDTYAREYFDSKGLGSYVSTFLRTTGAAADAVGTYMFWALGGSGFGFKGVGLLEKSVADIIDSAHYARHAKTDSLGEKVFDEGKIVGEGLVERAAAYLPLGIGETADLLRGKSKYDTKVTNRALSHAKQNFMDYIRKTEIDKPRIASLKNFKNPEYDLEEDLRLAG